MDMNFYQAALQAASAGVEFYACSCAVSLEGDGIRKEIKVVL
jgi:DNA-binding sugar fermentation-stimulating protein